MNLLLALVLLSQETEPAQVPSQGFRFALPRDGFAVRRDGFVWGWNGTVCEIQSRDGTIFGVLALHLPGKGLRAFADSLERGRRAHGQVASYEQSTDESIRAGLLRTYRIRWKSGDEFRYTEILLVRGSRNLCFTVWTPESSWERSRAEIDRIVRSVESPKLWSCPACGGAVAPAKFCAECGASLLPADEALAALSLRHGIQVVADPKRIYPFRTLSGARIEAREATDVSEYSASLAAELSRYPAGVLAAIGIERIVLCADLRQDGAPIGAVTDYDTDTIHFDVVCGRNVRHYNRQIVHHEIFHLIDHRDDGEAHADLEWEKLNPRDFRYGARDDRRWQLDDSIGGFLNGYSTSRVQEDKAEIFGFLMAVPEAVRERSRKDPVIAEKVKRMRERIGKWSPKLLEALER